MSPHARDKALLAAPRGGAVSPSGRPFGTDRSPHACENALPAVKKRHLFRRRPWENGSAIVIGLGILMQVQPLALELYTWSFAVIVVGSVAFLVTSHFPE